ncbi:hypothetical protein NBRC116494_17660 [Aurantivibrio plasticivorans]
MPITKRLNIGELLATPFTNAVSKTMNKGSQAKNELGIFLLMIAHQIMGCAVTAISANSILIRSVIDIVVSSA